jgi:hypothetical protein
MFGPWVKMDGFSWKVARNFTALEYVLTWLEIFASCNNFMFTEVSMSLSSTR